MAAEQKSITDAVIETISDYSSHIESSGYADILIHVQDGRPVMLEITSKHKPKPRPKN